MKSQINDDFLKVYRKLLRKIRESARKSYQLFRDNPHNPSLNFKPVHPNQPIYSVRINHEYRTIGIPVDDIIIAISVSSELSHNKIRKGEVCLSLTYWLIVI